MRLSSKELLLGGEIPTEARAKNHVWGEEAALLNTTGVLALQK